MLPPLVLRASLLASALALVLGAAFMRAAFPALSSRRGARLALALVASGLAAAHAAWGFGESLGAYPVSYWGAAIASGALVVLAFGVASLPVAALVRVVTRRRPRVVAPEPSVPETPAIGRRTALEAGIAAIPLVATGAAATGFASTRAPVPLRPIRIPVPSLPRALDGFTILQLSDLHLGVARDLRDLERLLATVDACPRRPDLAVLTGDIAEDPRLLPDALRMLAAMRFPAGVYACLGNHEYLRDIRLARPTFERSDVPLLVDEGLSLRYRGERLHVAGVDDPVIVHADVRPWLRGHVERALRDAPDDALRVLLAHRPEAFDLVAPGGARPVADLVLSGHTHGGQIGFGGKSAFEPLWPDGYLWGSYARGDGRLYTTSGFGHWFPFRLGCPAEAPLLVLRATPA